MLPIKPPRAPGGLIPDKGRGESLHLFLASLVLILGVLCCAHASSPDPTSKNSVHQSDTNVPLVQAQVENETRPLLPNFFGYSNGLLDIFSPQCRPGILRHPDFLRALAALNPGTLRYPAGTMGNYFDWETGWMVPKMPPGKFQRALKRAPASSTFSLEDFREMIKATGATPVWNLNILTSTLDHQLKMLKRAKELGMPITFVELGNEFYLDVPHYVTRFPTGADYGSEASKWITAIKRGFPEARIAAVSAHSSARKRKWNPRGIPWNTRLFSTLHGADAVTVHLYHPSNIRRKETFEATDVTGMLGAPFAILAELQETLREIPVGLEVWITEFNLQDQWAPVHGTWAHGLFVLTESLLFLDEKRIALIEPHAILGKAVFAALFGDEEAFHFWEGVKSPDPGLKTVPLQRSAMGWGLSLFADSVKGMTSSQRILFLPNLTLRDCRKRPYPMLIGRTFANRNHRTGLVINLGRETISLDTSALAFTAFESIHADPIVLIVRADSLQHHKGLIGSRPLQLPPYSATRLIEEGKPEIPCK